MENFEITEASRPKVMHLGGDGDYSGVPTYLEQLCLALQHEIDFTIVSDCNTGGYDFAKNNIKLREIKGMRTGLSLWKFMRSLYFLEKEISKSKPDLIWAHPHMSLVMLRILVLLRRLNGRFVPPIAVTYHGLPFGEGYRPLVSALSSLFERWILRVTPEHDLNFLSRGAAECFQKRMGRKALEKHQCNILANCSNLGGMPERQRNENPTLLMIARASYQKNHRVAAQIMASLPDHFQLLLCGAGTDHSKMAHEFEAVQSGLAERVQFLGSMCDVRPLLAQADLLLLTSRYEGMPIAALEAFEAGVPVALSEISGTAEILSHHPMSIGLDRKQPWKTVDEIIDLVEKFRSDPSASEIIHRVWEKHFSHDQWVGNARALLEKMVDNPQTNTTSHRRREFSTGVL